MKLEDSFRMIYTMSTLAADRGYYLISMEAIDNLHQYDTTNTKVVLYKSHIYILCQQPEKALDFIFEWSVSNEMDDRVLFILGYTYTEMDDYGEASFYLKKLQAYPNASKDFISILDGILSSN